MPKIPPTQLRLVIAEASAEFTPPANARLHHDGELAFGAPDRRARDTRHRRLDRPGTARGDVSLRVGVDASSEKCVPGGEVSRWSLAPNSKCFETHILGGLTRDDRRVGKFAAACPKMWPTQL